MDGALFIIPWMMPSNKNPAIIIKSTNIYKKNLNVPTKDLEITFRCIDTKSFCLSMVSFYPKFIQNLLFCSIISKITD